MSQSVKENSEKAGQAKGQISNEALKAALYRELELQIDLTVYGVNLEPEDARALNLETGSEAPAGAAPAATEAALPNQPSLSLPYGLSVGVRFDPKSLYGLVAEEGKPVLYKYGKKTTRIGEVEFKQRSRQALADRTTSDGVPFRNIARIDPVTGLVHVSFSKECSLKDKGEECLFCNYDNRKSIIKTAQQVGEVFAAAVEAGIATSFHLTGGFIPERRELENYIDVAEEIKSRTGLKNFNGSISMGAPQDYGIFDKFKEAGWSLIGSNMEIWDRNFRKAIVPGKENQCGGYDNWLNSLEYAARVFGKGHVFSNIVAGIEPKKPILEGVEYLVSKDIVGKAGIWRPTPGSGLDKHRSPETSWHLDVAQKVVGIYRKYGVTLDQLHSYHSAGGAAGVVYRIEEEYFENGKIKPWKYPPLKNQTKGQSLAN
jgi:hypothetical protein